MKKLPAFWQYPPVQVNQRLLTSSRKQKIGRRRKGKAVQNQPGGGRCMASERR